MSDPEVTVPPVKRARKPKAAKPAPAPKAPRKPRLEPARTLRRRIDDLGAYCLEAFDRQRKRGGNYDAAYESAAQQAEQLLASAGRELAPKLLDSYAAVIWEDQDECLEVRPEDVRL